METGFIHRSAVLKFGLHEKVGEKWEEQEEGEEEDRWRRRRSW
jgi:hypothetical protein